MTSKLLEIIKKYHVKEPISMKVQVLDSKFTPYKSLLLLFVFTSIEAVVHRCFSK